MVHVFKHQPFTSANGAFDIQHVDLNWKCISYDACDTQMGTAELRANF